MFDIKQKIKDLFTLASNPNVNPHEAENCRKTAQALMAKYGLTKEDVFGYHSRPPVNKGNGRVEMDIADVEMLIETIENLKKELYEEGSLIDTLLRSLENELNWARAAARRHTNEIIDLNQNNKDLKEQIEVSREKLFLTIFISSFVTISSIIVSIIQFLK